MAESGEDIRIQLLILARAQLQELQQARAELDKIGTGVNSARNKLGQYTAKTKEVREAQAELNTVLSQSFGPRVITSVEAFNSSFLRLGQSLALYAKTGRETGLINKSYAVSLRVLADEFRAVGAAGVVDSQVMDDFAARLGRMRPPAGAATAAVRALRAEIELMRGQMQQAAITEQQQLNPALKQSEKLGQGLLLSFSLTQLAAGQLSGAMFGLGFAILFTGMKFLNFTTIISATAIALGSLALEKVQKKFKDISSATEDAAKRSGNLREAIAEVRGEMSLFAEDAARMATAGDDISEGFKRQLDEAKKGPSIFGAFKTSFEAISFKAVRPFSDTPNLFTLIERRLSQDAVKVIEEAQATLDTLRQTIDDELQKIRDDVQAEEALEIRLAPIKLERAELDREFDEQRDAIHDNYEQQNNLAREHFDQQIDLRRDALENEIEVIKDGLKLQTDAIRDALEQQVDARREALEIEVDSIREQSQKVIDALKDKASEEIDANKEKIDALQDQEKELEQSLNDLRQRRSQIPVEILKAEAELAALEREAALFGVGVTEEQAQIKARIAGLNAESDAINSNIDERENSIAAIAGQIKALQDLIEQIEETRDDAIDAAEDEADRRIDIAKKVADAEIDAAKDAADALISEANRAADDVIDAANRRADGDIDAMNRSADNSIKRNNEIAELLIGDLDTEKDRRDDILDKQEQAIRNEEDLEKTIRDKVLPVLQEYVDIQKEILGGHARDQIPVVANMLRAAGLDEKEVQRLLREIFQIPAPLPMKSYQHGGVVPGPLGAPRLAVVHGGEEFMGVNGNNGNNGKSSGSIAVYLNIGEVNVNKMKDLDKITNAVNKGIGQRLHTTLRSRRLSS